MSKTGTAAEREPERGTSSGGGQATIRQRAADHLGGNAGLRVQLTPIEVENLNNHFTFQPASEQTRMRYEAVTSAAKDFARCLLEWCPQNPDRAYALQLVDTARMMANQAIAHEGQATLGT